MLRRSAWFRSGFRCACHLIEFWECPGFFAGNSRTSWTTHMSGVQPIQRSALDSLRGSPRPASWLFVCTSLAVSTQGAPFAHLCLTMCFVDTCLPLGNVLHFFLDNTDVQPWPLRNPCFTDCRASECFLCTVPWCVQPYPKPLLKMVKPRPNPLFKPF